MKAELSAVMKCTEMREIAGGYIKGLLSQVGRKNGWQLAERVGHKTPYAIQHLLGRVIWDAEELRARLIHYVWPRLDDGKSVLVLDETGFIRKGQA